MLAAGAPHQATAHPHIWIMASATFVFEGGKLAEVRHRWVFDDLFSSYLLTEFNGGQTDLISEEARVALRDNAFSNLRELQYFTYLRHGESPLALDEAKNFKAFLDKGSLVYDFTLALHEPVAVSGEPVVLGIYDPTYYVDVLLDEDAPAAIAGDTSGACRHAVKDDPARTYYFGLIVPKGITLTCTAE